MTAATDEMAFLEPVHVAVAYLVFVAIDAHGRPRDIARLRPEADTERRRMREAEIRRAHRLSRTAAIETARGSLAAPEWDVGAPACRGRCGSCDW